MAALRGMQADVPEESLDRDAPSFRLSADEARSVIATLGSIARFMALLALADLGVRSALRLELRWDTFAYHLPFAALRGGLHIPYDLNDQMRPTFDGYPPLPHLLQGVLWRATGSMNATGVVNYLAFAGFLAYCQRYLRAPFWLVALISLTAPLVVIHASTSYVDLFGNSFLAAGACSCLYLFLFPDRPSRGVLVGGLAALTAACWSKYLLVPIAALIFVLFAAVGLGWPRATGFSRRSVALLGVAAVLLSAAPYIENWIVLGNPFWPFRLPIGGDLFRYTNDAIQGGVAQKPYYARQSSQLCTFVQSLLEDGYPTRYLHRTRWTIDQGNTTATYRMGGFWGIAVMVYGLGTVAALWVCLRWRGAVAGVAILLVLTLVGCLPQSHQLRYYLFIPLVGAGTLGMLWPRLVVAVPQAAPACLALSMGLFLHMAIENWPHYRIEVVGQAEAAVAWGANAWWPRLKAGETYCAVNMIPMALLLTGPTLSEYTIVDRSVLQACPPGSVPITHPWLAPR